MSELIKLIPDFPPWFILLCVGGVNGGFAFMAHAHVLLRRSFWNCFPVFFLWFIIFCGSLNAVYTSVVDYDVNNKGLAVGYLAGTVFVFAALIIESILSRDAPTED